MQMVPPGERESERQMKCQRNILEQKDEKYFSAKMRNMRIFIFQCPSPLVAKRILQKIETALFPSLFFGEFPKNFDLQYSSKPLFYLPTRLLCINRIVRVIEVVNVKVFSSGAWPLLMASSGFWQQCLRNPK